MADRADKPGSQLRVARRGLVDRKFHVRDCPIFVIATEGEKTEKPYFESLFNDPRIKVHVLPTGPDGLSSPKHVADRLKDAQKRYQLAVNKGDEFWLVMDTDHHVKSNHVAEFKAVCQQAEQKGIGLAISAPCFELWLYLHFADSTQDMTDSTSMEAHIRKHVPGYTHSDPHVHAFTREGVRAAIERARDLDSNPEARIPEAPGTRVYRLAENLIRRLRQE
jgi:hypothetical protein